MSQPALDIPPGRATYPVNISVCPAACTAHMLPQPVTLLQGAFHMHGLGKAARVRHFRGDRCA